MGSIIILQNAIAWSQCCPQDLHGLLQCMQADPLQIYVIDSYQRLKQGHILSVCIFQTSFPVGFFALYYSYLRIVGIYFQFCKRFLPTNVGSAAMKLEKMKCGFLCYLYVLWFMSLAEFNGYKICMPTCLEKMKCSFMCYLRVIWYIS